MLSLCRRYNYFFVHGIADKAQQDKWPEKSRTERIFYVYIKVLPNGKPFFVGKGFGYRFIYTCGRNSYYKNIVIKYGKENLRTTIFPMENEESALKEEQRLIAYFKALGCKLSNMTDGGEGTSGFKRQAWNKGKHLTIVHRQRTSLGRLGIKVWNKGLKTGPLSEEHKRKLSKAHLGIEPWHKGKKISKEYCENVSKGRRAQIDRLRHQL